MTQNRKICSQTNKNLQIERFIHMISSYTMQEYFAKFGEIEQNLQLIEQYCLHGTQKNKDEILEKIADLTLESPVFCRLHILSFCMKVGGGSRFTERLLEEVLSADYGEVGEYNKLSYFWQIEVAVFQNAELGSSKAEQLSARLYRDLFEAFEASFGLCGRNYIPAQERDRSLVFVFTGQLLGMEHAPTKTLLDRCWVLQKILGKKVFVVNTAMQIPAKGQAPFYGLVNAEYAKSLADLKELVYRGEHFSYYQCKDNMPDLETIAELIRLVKKKKPFYLVDIGGSDICADLCGLFVPQVTVSTVFSKIAVSCGEYQLADRELTGEDKKVLTILGVKPEKVKRTMFTFSFKEQTHCFTRKDLGLPQEAFIVLVAGWRLDEEVDAVFLEMLEHTVSQKKNIAVAFMGIFNSCNEKVLSFPTLQKHIYYLGRQMDALAAIQCCDLYVNPKRYGGGSSMAEALYQGLPAVTLPMGDAFAAAGREFCAADYRDMEAAIIKYASDGLYYREMSQKARRRAKILLDSENHFGRIISQIEDEMTCGLS